MTGGSSTGSCGSSVPGRPGGTFPSGTGHGPHSTPVSVGGRWPAPSTGCSEPRRPGQTLPVTSTGWCRSIPPSSAPTSMPPGPEKGLRNPGLGRSRGGLTSKVHLACDTVGRPLTFTVTGGNTNDRTQFTTVMEAIRMPRLGPGRPRARPAHVLGDKGYSSRAIRTWLRRRGIRCTIPRTGRPGPQPGPARQPGRATAGLRPRQLQTAQRRGTLFQPPEAVA